MRYKYPDYTYVTIALYESIRGQIANAQLNAVKDYDLRYPANCIRYVGNDKQQIVVKH